MSGFCPLAIFSFTRYIPTPWIFVCAGFSAVVQCGKSCGIQYWGFLLFFCLSKLIVFHRLNFLEVLLFSASPADSVKIFFSLLPCLYQGISKVLERNALNLQAMSHELLSLTSLIFVSWWRSYLGLSSLLSDNLTHMALFTCFIQEKKD